MSDRLTDWQEKDYARLIVKTQRQSGQIKGLQGEVLGLKEDVACLDKARSKAVACLEDIKCAITGLLS